MGRIKDSLSQLVGKTIHSVVICQTADAEPKTQMFLVFKDDTSFEFWIDQGQLSMASTVDEEDLEKVVSLATQREGTSVHVVESPLARIGKERIEREPDAAKNNPLEGIGVAELDEENALFLAIHRRDALLCLMARATDNAEVGGWVDLISAAFGSLLQRCSMDDLCQLYQNQSRWNSVVRPPSVIVPELMLFLGGLSVVNRRVYEHLQSRGTIEAFLKLSNCNASVFKDGENRGREILALMQA